MRRNSRSSIAAGATLLLAIFAPGGIARAQSIEVVPPVAGGPSAAPRVRLVGFPAGSEVEVSFTRTPPDRTPPSYRSSARYRVGSNGNVDLSDAPISGGWALALPEAPFWTMRADPAAPLHDPAIVLIEARAGSIRRAAEYRPPDDPEVTTEPVPQFAGAFLVRARNATGRLPLIIVLGGSDGGDRTARDLAPRFAALGFAALGLPYHSPDRGNGQAIPGLPTTFSNIPLDRLQQVRDWAARDPRLDADRIGLWGFSKGAEFAILAAAHFPWLDAVAAIAASDVVWEGFTYENPAGTGTPSFSFNGRPLPFVPYSAPGRGRDVKDAGRRANPARAAAARIPIERYAGALLVAGGALDTSWDSAGMSQAIAERRAAAGRSTVSLIFPDAGHYLLDSLSPIEPAPGETAEGTGLARLRTWRATVDLFRTALLEPGPTRRPVR